MIDLDLRRQVEWDDPVFEEVAARVGLPLPPWEPVVDPPLFRPTVSRLEAEQPGPHWEALGFCRGSYLQTRLRGWRRQMDRCQARCRHCDRIVRVLSSGSLDGRLSRHRPHT